MGEKHYDSAMLNKGGEGGEDCSFCLCQWGLRVDSSTMGSAKPICSSHFTEEALKTLLHINTLACSVWIADVALSAWNGTRMFGIILVCLLTHMKGASAGLCSMRAITKSHKKEKICTK